MTTRCDFALAIVKGLVEHGDHSSYFGSFGGMEWHLDAAAERGLVSMQDGRPVLTDLGRATYVVEKLDQLPQRKLSRAYMWDWSAPR